jgi:hypothetical protein
VEARVSQVDGVKFAIQARSHTLLCDQPTENRGTDAGAGIQTIRKSNDKTAGVHEFLRNSVLASVRLTLVGERARQE